MNDRKKVYFVITYLGGQGWGGAHRVACILANYLAKMKHDVTVIVWKDSPVDYPISDEVKIIWLHCDITRKWNFIKPCLMTRNILKQSKGAYLYAFMSKMAAFARLYTVGLDIKLIGSERTDPRKEPRARLFRFIRNVTFCFFYKSVYQTPDAMAYFPKLAQRNGCVIPNPVTPNLPERSRGEQKKEFVTFCRIDAQKNLPMMIDAFVCAHKLHSDFVLHIFGTGKAEEEIKSYIKSCGAENYIIMDGFSNNVHEKIVDSYAYLSSSDYEGLSNSMLEAMAMGLPCICTDCPIGGARMMIENGVNGILVAVGDSAAMAKEICRLIEEPELCNRLSQEAKNVRTLLNEGAICEKWERLMY